MKKQILTYQDLFDTVTSNRSDNQDLQFDRPYMSSENIFVRTPTGDLSEVFAVVKKHGVGIEITSESGRKFSGEENHILKDADGVWVKLKDAETIQIIDNGELYIEKIVSKEHTGETIFYDINIASPHEYVSPNGLIHHNTYTIFESLKEENLVKDKDWFLIKGKITTAALYQTLFMHREGKLLVFDDTDSVWGDQDAANILKAALDSYDERMVSWYSNRTTNISKMSPEDKEEYYQKIDAEFAQDASSAKIKLPSEFEYKGRIIFISNLNQDKLDPAVLNRSAKIDMTLTNDEVFARIESILGFIGNKDVPTDIKKEILDFIRVETKKGVLDAPSIRTFVSAEDLYRSGISNWRELLQYI